MSSFKVNIKWGKEKYTSIECNVTESPDLFKAQIFALTGVQPDRQKVMLKGATLKDAWTGFKIKDGVTFLIMGSADALPEAPVQKTLFMEDMTDEQLASAFEMAAGLKNLGNSCYLNATVQCLHSVSELRDALKKFDGKINPGMAAIQPAESITAAMRNLFDNMDKTTDGVLPIYLLQLLHIAFPQFAEKAENGAPQQQDANECWVQLMRLLQQKLPLAPPTGEVQPTEGASGTQKKGFIDQYFGVTFESTLKCVEAEDEPVTKSTELVLQLSCFITQEVKYLHTGLKNVRRMSVPMPGISSLRGQGHFHFAIEYFRWKVFFALSDNIDWSFSRRVDCVLCRWVHHLIYILQAGIVCHSKMQWVVLNGQTVGGLTMNCGDAFTL